jgi:hypothetical protein
LGDAVAAKLKAGATGAGREGVDPLAAATLASSSGRIPPRHVCNGFVFVSPAKIT